MLSLSKTNYPPELLSWLTNVLQIGFLGEIQFVVPAAAGNTGYRQELLKWGVPSAHMHLTVVAAEAAMVADRNDVACIYPGNVLEAATIDWDKAHTHLVGMGGPNTRGGSYRPYIYSTDTGIVETLHVEGRACQFHNFAVANYGNNSACLAGATLNAEATYWKNVCIQGNINTSQAQNANCCSFQIDDDASMCLFVDCMIGSNVNTGVRNQANTGQLNFVGDTLGAGNGKFKGCTFLSRSETVTCAMVALVDDHARDRLWEFENCMFHNFWVNDVNRCNQVFYNAAGQTNTVALKDCMSIGYDEWQDANTRKMYQSNMPDAGTAGGLAIEPTTSIE